MNMEDRIVCMLKWIKKCWLTKGTNLYDFFVIPTVRYNTDSCSRYFITIEWLKWYIGITWNSD